MPRAKKVRSLIVAGVVIGATQLALVPPAHAEEVCVPIDTQTDLGPGLLLCAGAGNDYNPNDPEVWAWLLSYNQTVASTNWTLGETTGGLPHFYGGVWVGNQLVTLTLEILPSGRLGSYVRVCASVDGGEPVCVLPVL